MTRLFARRAFLPDGWRQDTRIEIGPDGRISGVEPDTRPASDDVDLGPRILLPAACNVHSHGFQRGMAGMTERRSAGKDDFWSWRKLMYRFLAVLTPDQLEALTALAFMETLEAGYAAIGEFHYVHHQPGGTPYADIAEMSNRVFAAARTTGIGLTHLPVLYTYGGADRKPLAGGQLRFGNDPDRFEMLVSAAEAGLSGLPADCRLGIAPHSLRATTPEELSLATSRHSETPIHIHAAEQTAEVEEISDWLGARPVEFLLNEAGADERWCLVHATQMTSGETAALARSRAVAGLCPVTEANLGDGIFNGKEYLEAGGAFAIGSDSNINISVAGELRQLEYSQRLKHAARNVLSKGGSVGESLYRAVLAGGVQALARQGGAIAVGAWADLVAINGNHLAFSALEDDELLDGWIFAGDDTVVTDVWAAGRHCVAEGRHRHRETIERTYREAMSGLIAAI